MRSFFSLLLIFLFLVCGSASAHPQICYFVPPAGWEIGKLLKPSPYIQIGFLGKGSSSVFRPSINLAFEEIDVDLKEYVKAVKEIHLSEPNTKCRDLGKFSMLAGEGRLLEITSSVANKEMKQFQALYVKEQTAYILTAAAAKEDLPKMQSEILKALQSLNVVPDLYAPLSDASQRTDLQALYGSLDPSLPEEKKKKHLEKMEKTLLEKYPQLGPHWRYLVLSEMHAKIFTP